MGFLTKICIPVVALGAAVISAPVLAQNAESASGNSAAAAAQPAQDANSAAVPTEPSANTAATPDQTASASSQAGNTQMAMNTTGNASTLSSIPDTKQKYSRAKRNADNQSEDETTKQLNQKESSLNGAGNAQ